MLILSCPRRRRTSVVERAELLPRLYLSVVGLETDGTPSLASRSLHTRRFHCHYPVVADILKALSSPRNTQTASEAHGRIYPLPTTRDISVLQISHSLISAPEPFPVCSKKDIQEFTETRRAIKVPYFGCALSFSHDRLLTRNPEMAYKM